MATLEIPSNVKCITSGQVPTTTNLKDGEFAFGKVGGVAKLYGNVNGVIIDFTGDGGGDIPANINTFTEVHDVLTLTDSDTLNTLGAKIVAIGQSVIHVRPNDTARAQVDRIMGNPSTGGPPSSYCDYWFKVLSERLIYVFFGYNGRWGFINYLYNSSQYSSDKWSMCPRWMPIDPSNIEASVADPLTLAQGLNIGRLGIPGVTSAYLKLTTSGIAYMLDSSAVSNALFSGGPIGNVKTLFGNKSIYGSGNIDLYRHIVWIRNETSGHQIYITVHIISSSNTPIDSLTNLFTVLSAFANEWYPCNGRVNIDSTNRGVAYNFNARTTSNGAVAFLRLEGTEGYYEWSAHSTGLKVSDTVTTV